MVPKGLSRLDTMNMTMLNDKGVATVLKVETNKNSAIASED